MQLGSMGTERHRMSRIGGQEAHHDPDMIRVDLVAVGGELACDEPVGDLGEETGAVTGTVGSLGATVVETLQALDRETGHPERRSAVPGSDEPDATRFVLRPYVDEWSFHKCSGGTGDDRT
jgi:hypothetical protein